MNLSCVENNFDSTEKKWLEKFLSTKSELLWFLKCFALIKSLWIVLNILNVFYFHRKQFAHFVVRQIQLLPLQSLSQSIKFYVSKLHWSICFSCQPNYREKKKQSPSDCVCHLNTVYLSTKCLLGLRLKVQLIIIFWCVQITQSGFWFWFLPCDWLCV